MICLRIVTAELWLTLAKLSGENQLKFAMVCILVWLGLLFILFPLFNINGE